MFSSLRVRLALLVLAAALPGILLTVYDYAIEERKAAADAYAYALGTARGVAAGENQLIENSRDLLAALVLHPAVRLLNPAACSEVARNLRGPLHTNIGVAAPDGRVLCSAVPMTRPVNIADSAYFRSAVKTRQFAVGEFQVGPITGRPALIVGYPMLDGSRRVRAVAFAGLDVSQIGEAAVGTALPPGSTVTLLDANGTVLARHPNGEAWIGRNVAQTPIFKAIQAAGGEGSAQIAGLDEQRRLYGFVTLPLSRATTRIYVNVGIPVEVAFGPAAAKLGRYATGLGAVALFVFFLTWLTADSLILRPVGRLITATQRLKRGDLSARSRMADRQGELGRLGQAFDEMAGAVQAQQAQLVESEARKSAVMDSALDAIITMDHDGRVVEFNPAAERIFGYRRADAIGHEMATLIIPPALRTRHRAGLARYLATGEGPVLGRRLELTGMRADGGEFPVELSIVRIPGDPPIFTGFVHDITERKRFEADLEALLIREQAARIEAEQTQRRSEFLAEAGKLLSASLDYRTTLANAARAAVPHVADWAAVDVIKPDGSLDRLAVAHTDPAKVEMAYELQRRYPTDPSRPGPIRDAIQSRRPTFVPDLSPVLNSADLSVEQRRLLQDLNPRSYIVAPIIMAGRVVALFTLVTAESGRRFTHEDVEMAEEIARRSAMAIENATHYREAQTLNLELEQRVADRTEQLQTANDELEAFSYSVAHDLRAPLRAIDGFSRLVVDEYAGQLPDEGRRYLDRVRQSAQRMGELIDDLLTFSRLARQTVNRQPVDMKHLVEQVIDRLREEHGGDHVAISVADLPGSDADPVLLRQVFANLLSNALKFSRTRAQPRIEVTYQSSGTQPIYIVRDNGVGFDMRYADKLFGVFQRLHRADEYEGTGVGLAIVQRIIHRHGGRIWAAAETDKGATFYFTLGGTGDGERIGGNPAD